MSSSRTATPIKVPQSLLDVAGGRIRRDSVLNRLPDAVNPTAAAMAAAAQIHHRSRDNIDYNKDLEMLLKENAEECESLGILHRASYEKYNRLSNYINIPVIILSSAIGFATGIDIGYSNMNIILGVGSIFVGIIKSIDTYFQLGKRSESHRLCSLQYQQIHKKIQIELALTRNQRQTAKDMLSVIKTDIKNLQDISPLVDQDIIDGYNAKYNRYTNVKKPNFVNGLTEVAINDTDEHGAVGSDVLHSRPRSLAGSNSNSDSEGDVIVGGGGGGGGGGRLMGGFEMNEVLPFNETALPYSIKPISRGSNPPHIAIDIIPNGGFDTKLNSRPPSTNSNQNQPVPPSPVPPSPSQNQNQPVPPSPSQNQNRPVPPSPSQNQNQPFPPSPSQNQNQPVPPSPSQNQNQPVPPSPSQNQNQNPNTTIPSPNLYLNVNNYNNGEDDGAM